MPYIYDSSPGFLQQLADTFSGPLYSMNNMFQGKDFGSIWRPLANSVGNLVDAVLPGDVIPDFLNDGSGTDYRGSWSGTLERMGIPEGPSFDLNPWVEGESSLRDMAGLAGDIFLDPVNLLTGGLHKAVKPLKYLDEAVDLAKIAPEGVGTLGKTLASQADLGQRALLGLKIPFSGGKSIDLIKGQPIWNLLTGIHQKLGVADPLSKLDDVADVAKRYSEVSDMPKWQSALQGPYQAIQKRFFSPSGTGIPVLDEMVPELKRMRQGASKQAVDDFLNVFQEYAGQDPRSLFKMVEEGNPQVKSITELLSNILEKEQGAGLLTGQLADEAVEYAPRSFTDYAQGLSKKDPSGMQKVLNDIADRLEIGADPNSVVRSGGPYGVGDAYMTGRRFQGVSTDDVNRAFREIGFEQNLFEDDIFKALAKRMDASGQNVATAEWLQSLFDKIAVDGNQISGGVDISTLIDRLKLSPEIKQSLTYLPEEGAEKLRNHASKWFGKIRDMEKNNAPFHVTDKMMHTTESVLAKMEEAFQKSKQIDPRIADELTKMIGEPQPGQQVLEAMKSFTNPMKRVMTMTPAFHLRNLLSGYFMNVMDTPGGLEDIFRVAGSTGEAAKAVAGKGDDLASALLQKGQESGILNTILPEMGRGASSAKDVLESLTAGKGKKFVRSINPFSGESIPAKAHEFLGTNVEATNRLARAIDFIKDMKKQGYNVLDDAGQVSDDVMNAAWKAAQESQIDYGSLTPFEDVMRQIMPFYSWTRKMTPRAVEKLVTEPATMTWPIKAAARGRGSSTVPEWLQSTLGIPMGKDAEGNDKYVSYLGLPQEELMKLGRFGDELFGMLNPALKLPIELATGQNTFKDTPIAEDVRAGASMSLPGIKELAGTQEWVDENGNTRRAVANPYVKHILESMPGLGTAMNYYNRATDERKSIADRLVNVLLPPKVVSVDSEREAARQNWSQIENIVNLLASMGKVRTFSAPYATEGGKTDPATQALMEIVSAQRSKQIPPEQIQQMINQLMMSLQ